tara:strand:+ start:4712 stop:5260 length:549 start_codon:yes stop_codon:yes gene_type:complete
MKKVLIILFLSVFLVSCLGTKKTVENSDSLKELEKIEISNDTTKTETINRAIDDEFLLSLRTSDSLANEAIRKALENFKQEKNSGTNRSSVYFDYDKMALVLKNSIGETKDTELETNSEIKIEKTREELISEYSETVIRMIPWWLWLVAAFFILPHIIKTVTAIINPLGAGITMITKKRNQQ